VLGSSLHPFDLPEDAWFELTDPVNFVIGSFMILVCKAGPKWDAFKDAYARKKSRIIGWRIGSTVWPIAFLGAPVLIGLLLPHIGTGDAFTYAVTLLVAGALVCVPTRLADLRDKQLIGKGIDPRTIRKAMWGLEYIYLFVALAAIFIWKFGGRATNHPVLRAIVWGVLVVAATDIYTLTAARNIAVYVEKILGQPSGTTVETPTDLAVDVPSDQVATAAAANAELVE
jgi:MFS family permease